MPDPSLSQIDVLSVASIANATIIPFALRPSLSPSLHLSFRSLRWCDAVKKASICLSGRIGQLIPNTGRGRVATPCQSGVLVCKHRKCKFKIERPPAPNSLQLFRKPCAMREGVDKQPWPSSCWWPISERGAKALSTGGGPRKTKFNATLQAEVAFEF